MLKNIKKLRFCFFIFFVLFNLTSCFRNLPKQPESIGSLSLDKTEALALDSGVLSIGGPGYEKWWDLFKDETLTRLIEEAIKENPYLESVKEKIQVAKALAEKERSLLLPKFHINFDENYEHLSSNGLFRFPPSTIPAVVNLLDLTIDFEYEFDFFGKNQHLFKAALGEAMASIASFAEAQLVISIEVAQHYFYYQYLLEMMELLEEEATIEKSLLEITDKRIEHALSDRIDLEEHKQKLLTIENFLVMNELERILEIHQINLLRGSSPDEKIDLVAESLDDMHAFPIASELSLDLIAQRPDVMSIKWMLEAAAHQVGAAKAAFYPSVNLAAFTGLEGLSWSTLFSPHSWIGSLQPAIHLPLYTGGKLTANLKDKLATYHKMIFEYNQLILQAAQEVADGVTMAAAYDSEISIEEEKCSSMRVTLDLLEKRYEYAVDPIMRSLEYKLQYLKEKDILFNKEYQKRLAMLKIIKALGGGYRADSVEMKGG